MKVRPVFFETNRTGQLGMGDLYIRPVALVYGRDAEAAVEQGAGLSLAGHSLALPGRRHR
jgi:hypothetical protein